MPCCRAAFKMGRRKEGGKEGGRGGRKEGFVGKKEGTKTAEHCRGRRWRLTGPIPILLEEPTTDGRTEDQQSIQARRGTRRRKGEEEEEDMSLLAPTTFNKRAQRERQIVEIESC